MATRPEAMIRESIQPRTPNFFIIGAPKCGTTALSEYLRTHPQVFFSDPKEPFFWCDDLPGMRRRAGIHKLDDYHGLFRKARTDHVAVGEGSTLYLHSTVAVPKIIEAIPEARIIAMVREPHQLVGSFHRQLLKVFQEDQRSLLDAWCLQDLRRSGEALPHSNRAPELLRYREIASLGTQLQRLAVEVPEPQRLVLHLRDLAEHPRKVYLAVLDFLGLEDDGRTEFPPVNEGALPRWPRLTRSLQGPHVASSSRRMKELLPATLVQVARRAKHAVMYSRPGVQAERDRTEEALAVIADEMCAEAVLMHRMLTEMNSCPPSHTP